MVNFKIIGICKQEALSIVPTEDVRYDLERMTELLSQAGHDVNDQGLMVTVSSNGHTVTIYTNGRMLITGVSTKEEAAQIATSLYDTAEPSRESVADRAQPPLDYSDIDESF